MKVQIGEVIARSAALAGEVIDQMSAGSRVEVAIDREGEFCLARVGIGNLEVNGQEEASDSLSADSVVEG